MEARVFKYESPRHCRSLVFNRVNMRKGKKKKKIHYALDMMFKIGKMGEE